MGKGWDAAAVPAGEFQEAGGTIIPVAPGPRRLTRPPEIVPVWSWGVTVGATPGQGVGPPGGSRLGPPRGKERPSSGDWPCSAGSSEEGGRERSAVGGASAEVLLSLPPETRTDRPGPAQPPPAQPPCTGGRPDSFRSW